MPVVLEAPLLVDDAEPLQRKLWTREECELLAESGVDLENYELIDGELICKVPKNHAHMFAVMLLYNWLNRICGEGRVIQEASIHLAPKDTRYSDPEPDLIVLRRPFSEIPTKADPDDILLVIEVSVTTLAMDTKHKAALYARAGIPDYWVLDVQGRRFLVHRDPAGGAYRSIVAFSENEPVSPLAAPEASIRAADLL